MLLLCTLMVLLPTVYGVQNQLEGYGCTAHVLEPTNQALACLDLGSDTSLILHEKLRTSLYKGSRCLVLALGTGTKMARVVKSRFDEAQLKSC